MAKVIPITERFQHFVKDLADSLRKMIPWCGGIKMSHRERYGLRGPIKACVEESTFAGAVTADGTQIPQWTSRYTTEFSVEGRLVSTRIRNSDGSEWVSSTSYDASGRMLKGKWGNEGGPATETVYFYDEHGKLLKITDSNKPDNPVTFRHDEHGRMIKRQVSRPEDYQPNTADARSPFEAADSPPNLPGGGSATTFFDEEDRPTEVQVRNAQGEIVNRATRVYDKHGRVLEEHQIWDRPETMFPAQLQEEILQAGGSMEELRRQLMQLMGGQPGPSSIAYSYDAEGRVTQTRHRIFNVEHVIDTVYNQHGDKATEITRCAQIRGQNGQDTQRPGLPSYSEVRYSYQYDDRGNWTEETVSHRSSPDGDFVSSTGRRRHLTYY
ncbi:MAG TPA: hypothetical protein VJS37_04575 [Terriglobales bacterium]|nr:hypothetical protein [Terriglobales bacterium]